MNAGTRAELAQALRRQREALRKDFFDAEADLRSIGEDREAELGERAQEERAARILSCLDDRSLREVQIVCRHGVVHPEGAIPSEAEHRILRKLVTDVAGCEEVVDHVRIDELLWERPDRTPRGPRERPRPARFEPVGTEDVVESTEEGLDYLAPDRPPSEEE